MVIEHCDELRQKLCLRGSRRRLEEWWQELARVEKRFWVYGGFDEAHEIDGFFAQLARQPFLLADADAMLTRACAFHRKGPFDDAPIKPFRLGHVARIIRVDDEDNVKIAVADMAHDWRRQTGRDEIALGFQYAFGEPADGNADVGGPPDATVA
jgi:hypothetical protein